ncbi:MAG: DNA polymerase I [Gammaproteobacteria bacterium]|nr:DNA polymerase I [Gammaproteobacteria bacterium]
MPKDKPFILIDGTSYLYRAFHAMPPLTNSKGQSTGAIYGVINMLRKMLEEHSPEKMAVIFDAKGKTFRDDMYALYKANRPPMPDDLREQIEPLYAVVRAMGLPVLIIEGVEADDVIGTLATRATKSGISTLISTGDKDMAQLVNEHVSLVNTMHNTYIDTKGVVDKFGVSPGQIIDYLTLIGDTVDNVPGVPKVGPKTATKWLAEYGSLDAIIQHADDIKGKVGENLRATLEQLPLSRKLVTIKCDVKLPAAPQELTLGNPDENTLKQLYTDLEFKTWLSELLSNKEVLNNKVPNKKVPNNKATDNDEEQQIVINENYQTILTESEFDSLLKELQRVDVFAFDTETTSLDYSVAEIVGVSFSLVAGHAAYIPVAHRYEGAPIQLSRDFVLEKLKPLLENPKKLKIGQNIKYDMSLLANYAITLRGISYDTMLESYVLDSTASRHDMDSLALKYLGHQTIKFEDVAGKGKKQITFDQIPIEAAAPYAAEDADITLQLHQALWPKLQKEKTLIKLYDEIEVPLISVLSHIERYGVLIDADMLEKQSVELAQRMEQIVKESYEVAGEEFNLASPKQIQEILFNKQKLPILQKTPKGQPSTAEAVLQELAYDYPLPKLILEHRGLSKLKSTYTDRLPEQISPKTGRVHTSYHQAVASTGRLSSSDPNLQNIPIRTAEGRRIRQAFIAPKDHKIVAADYSQIELRILAHLSGDEGLLNAFANKEDIHKATAAEVFSVSTDKVSNEQRRSAKAINFGLVYGMSAYGLAKQLGTNRSTAQEYVDRYFDRYPGVKTFMDQTRERAHDIGYVETVFGRRLYLPEINSKNHQRRQYAERTAINAPMQGTAADIIKLAMINCDRWISQSKLDIKMVMQVHDELVFEIANMELDDALASIPELMVSVAKLKVPLEVDVGVGKNWDEAH